MTTTSLYVPNPVRPRTTRGDVLADAATMFRRNLVHLVRYPSLTVFVVAVPVLLLLLFVTVFGGTLGAGLPGVEPADGGAGADEYLAYLVPGILLMTIAGGVVQTAAIVVAQDMTQGIVARFRTMSIARASVLTGHVLGDVVLGVIGLVGVLGVALLLGFRTTTGPAGWTAAAGVLLLVTVAMTWLGVAMGMAAKSVESASNLPMPLILLPFLSSGFVPPEAMPGWLEWFATYQPFTAFTETVRVLLLGGDLGWYGWATLGWCAVIGVAGYAWALSLYERRSVGQG